MIHDTSVLDIIVLLVAVIISLTIHEFMHAYVGHKLGDTTAFEAGRVSFNPLQHIDPFATVILPIITIILFGVPLLAARPVPFNPSRLKYDDYGSAMVAAAGPLSNLGLAAIGAFLAHVFVSSSTLAHMFVIFAVLNVAVFVFNLIPIPPLDGSRVLYAFAPDGVRELFNRIEPFGIVLVFVLVLYTGANGVLLNIQESVLRLLGLA